MKSRKIILLVCFVFFIAVCYNFKIKYYFSDKLFQKGDYYFNGGEYNLEKAQKYYNAALIVYPKMSYAHYQKARIYLVTNRLDEAKKEIDRELAIHPENERSFYVRGLIDGYRKDYLEAENDFKQFIQYAPNEWAGYMDLSWIYIADDKFQEAADVSRKGLQKFSENPWLYSNNGLALYKLGKYEEAKKSLLKGKDLAQKVTPDDWKKTYPGNNPSGAESGIKDLKAAISYNLALTFKKLGDAKGILDEYGYYTSLFSPNDLRKEKIYEIF